MGHKVGPSAVAGDDGTATGEQVPGCERWSTRSPCRPRLACSRAPHIVRSRYLPRTR